MKKQLGKVIRDALGKESDSWVGRQIALSTKHVTWTDYYGKDQEGETIVARVIPANAYAAATGAEPQALVPRRSDLDDTIPF